MENTTNDYHISFFRPTTPQALRNRNMVAWLVLIWAVAIFGFQILLRVMEKPTPEASYITFQNVWENVKSDQANEIELQEFGKSVLAVLGKGNIDSESNVFLDNALAYSVNMLTADSMRSALIAKVENFEALKASISSFTDPQYMAAKKMLSDELSPVLGLEMLDVRTQILPLELSSKNMDVLSAETIEKLPSTMEIYLIHNQSVLTDTKFLGFPFHYFYTAVFLLVLFVGLCLSYCIRIDKMNVKMEIEE